MSWLNLNEGFNSLKGQLTNFASNVLADDDNEGTAEHNYDYDKLKHLCAEQELQIQNLKRINEELKQHKVSNSAISQKSKGRKIASLFEGYPISLDKNYIVKKYFETFGRNSKVAV
nr:uncharacterized protein LOC111508442 [Leptinotarsa decemlineata]